MIPLIIFNYAEYLKVCLLACGLKVVKQNKYSRSCRECGCYMDLEDYMFGNSCWVCGKSQGYDKEWYELNCNGGVR